MSVRSYSAGRCANAQTARGPRPPKQRPDVKTPSVPAASRVSGQRADGPAPGSAGRAQDLPKCALAAVTQLVLASPVIASHFSTATL